MQDTKASEGNYPGGSEGHLSFGHFPQWKLWNVPRPVGRMYPALPLITFFDVSGVITHWKGQMGDDWFLQGKCKEKERIELVVS